MRAVQLGGGIRDGRHHLRGCVTEDCEWLDHLNSQQGISLTRSSPLIQGNAIEYNGSYGIYVYDTSSRRSSITIS